MRRFVIAGSLLLLAVPARADMYQDGSNAKAPEAINNLAVGGAIWAWDKHSDLYFGIHKTPFPSSWTGNAYAGPAAVFQMFQDQDLAADKSAPAYVFHTQASGNGVITGGGSRGFWPGVMSLMNKSGDGSAHSFTFANNLTAAGPSNYNELTGLAGTAFNAGSTNGYVSAVEVVAGDSADAGATHYKTLLHAIIGRVAKYDNSWLSDNPHQSNNFEATSEGTQPVGSMFYAYAQPGSPGWYTGIDLHDATITSGVAIKLGNNHGLVWRNAANSADLAGVLVGADNYLYLGVSGLEVKMPSMTATTGGGGMYVCIDGGGKLYKKATCP